MKKIVLILGLLVSVLAVHIVWGQSTDGIITYEVKMNMHRRLQPDQEGMKNMVPEYHVVQEQLFFNANESLYKPVPEEEDDDFQDEQGGGRRMHFRRPQADHYTNQATATKIIAQEFMGKKYLIEDSISIAPWKLGTEVKTIQGYECRQASYYNEERKQEIVVWYTDTLRPFLGPEGFNSLPGAVLQVDINGGERVITAQKIELRALAKSEMKVPGGGQRTTDKEFRKMVEEHMKRMGGQGGVMIRN